MHRDLPLARLVPRGSRLLAAVVTLAVVLSVWVPTARADDLDDQKDRVNKQLTQTRRDLGESNGQLDSAAAELQKSHTELSRAQAALERTRAELAAAQDYDQKMADKLASAQEELRRAKAQVATGKRNLAAEQIVVGDVARHSYQTHGGLLPIAVLAQQESLSDLQTQKQWNDTMQAGTEADMERLRTIQKQLDDAEAEQARIEKQVAADRNAAAAALARSQELERQATAQQQQVTDLVAKNETARKAAQQQVNIDQKRYDQLATERGQIEQRIAERIAQQRAAERARQEQERRRQEAERRAEALRRAREAREARRSQPKQTRTILESAPRKKTSRSTRRTQSPSSSGLQAPVAGPITSPFGMRLHPVLGYWKLHDGMDYGVGCGTPIYAVTSGRVAERYFNAGYGNRVIIDHGNFRGQNLTTSYNHLSRYAVSAGQWVRKGQVIGYVGTTGYSTGCHLHLMVWRGGNLTNPASLF